MLNLLQHPAVRIMATDLSDAAKPSYIRNILSLIGNGISSVFGRFFGSLPGIGGFVGSVKRIEITKAPDGHITATASTSSKTVDADVTPASGHFHHTFTESGTDKDCKVLYNETVAIDAIKVMKENTSTLPSTGQMFCSRIHRGGTSTDSIFTVRRTFGTVTTKTEPTENVPQ